MRLNVPKGLGVSDVIVIVGAGVVAAAELEPNAVRVDEPNLNAVDDVDSLNSDDASAGVVVDGVVVSIGLLKEKPGVKLGV